MNSPQFVNPILNTPGFWLVTTFSGGFDVCDSALSALRKAYERSGQSQSFFDAPNALRRVGTDDGLNAEQVVAEWRNLGWPLPSTPQAE